MWKAFLNRGPLVITILAVIAVVPLLQAQTGPTVFTPRLTVSPGPLTVTTGLTTVQDITISGTCTGCTVTSPGGANTQVQFNNAGAFGGDAGFTYNSATDTASLGAVTLTTPLAVTSGGTGVITSTGTGSTVRSASPTLTGTTTVADLTVSGTCTGCGTATPGGLNTQVQFNNSGVFGGDAGLTYIAGTDTLSATNLTTSAINSIAPSDWARLSTSNTFASANTFSGDILASSAAPKVAWLESGASANNGRWDILVDVEQLLFRVVNDADTFASPFMSVNRTGTTVDNVNFAATAVQINGSTISNSSGTFTAAITGMTAALNCNMEYKVINGHLVSLMIDGGATCNGTSNTTNMSMTGIPAAIRPAHTIAGSTYTINTSNPNDTLWSLDTGGTITFALGGISGSYTASGTKGIGATFMIIYDLAN